MKCARCHVEHSRIGPNRAQSYCASCHAQYMREHRPKHSALPATSRRKANARSYANVYQKRGKIVREPCAICSADAQKHHDDYSLPTAVRWLCREHHLALHQGETP